MFEIFCYDENFEIIRQLVQWDDTRFIIIKNINTQTAPEFHFCNQATEKAIPVSSQVVKDSNGNDCYIAEIPKFLLQQPYDIILYIYVNSVVQDTLSYKTTHMARIPLVPRPKPEDYPYEVVESHIDYLGKLIAQAKELEESLKNGIGSLGVNPDHAQNDPTKPDYIKNRLAYEDKKYEDIIVEDVDESPVVAMLHAQYGEDEESYPYYIKICDIPENAIPSEMADAVIGYGMRGESMKFDDPEMFDQDALEYLGVLEFGDKDENGNSKGALKGFKYPESEMWDCWGVITSDDNVTLSLTDIDYDKDSGETTEITYTFNFPQSGVYTFIMDYEEDEETGEILNYYPFTEVYFSGVKKIDKKFLPNEALSKSIEVDDYISYDSESPVTSSAIYHALQNKLDRPWNAQEGYVLGYQNGMFQMIPPPQTGVSQMAFDMLSDRVNNKADKISVTKSDNGKIMMVENGQWAAVAIPFADEEEF